MKKLIASILIGASFVLTGCDDNPRESRDFTLPEGYASNGALLFEEFQCTQCHTIPGTEYQAGEWREQENVGISVQLGGKSDRIQTYSDLVTSIINPSHRIAQGYSRNQVVDEGETPDEDESKMPVYNSIMTVEELVDLVAFLEEQYTLQEYYKTVYHYFTFPF